MFGAGIQMNSYCNELLKNLNGGLNKNGTFFLGPT